MPRVACALLILLLLLPRAASAEPVIRAWLAAFDVLDQPITSVEIGQQFYLRAFVEDLRDPHVGVVAAYLGTSFNPSIVSPSGPLTIDTYFNDLLPLTSTTPASVAGGGLALVINPADLPAPGGQLLFAIPMLATTPGTAIFSPGPVSGDNIEWFILLDDNPVSPGDIELVGLQLNVVPEPSGIILAGIAATAVGICATRRRKC